MNLDEASRICSSLASRVDRLRPLNHDPEAYFVERGEIVNELVKLARDLRPTAEFEKPARGDFRPGAIEHKGRRVAVETRGARRSAPDKHAEARKVFK